MGAGQRLYAVEQTDPTRAGSRLLDTRLPELVLIEVLRRHVRAGAEPRVAGRVCMTRSPHPRLANRHAQPERHWTVAELAREVAVSRSLLNERFRQLLGRPPIRYLSEWRIHRAEELLATTDHTVATIARRVGYDSEEASPAFKRARKLSPSHRRMARSGPTGV